MCCEVSYLYVRLLTQLSYLTYVGFLNIPLQTQGVILMKPLSLFTKEQLKYLGLTRLGSYLGSKAWWLGLAWSDHGSMAQITA